MSVSLLLNKFLFDLTPTTISEISKYLRHIIFLSELKLKGSYDHLNFVIFKNLICALESQSILCGFYSGFYLGLTHDSTHVIISSFVYVMFYSITKLDIPDTNTGYKKHLSIKIKADILVLTTTLFFSRNFYLFLV